jgi:phosphoribosylamine--glycine ligase
MNILVVGGGGREHALCWKLGQSPLCRKLYCAPGNAGIADFAQCVPIGAEDVDQITAFAREKKIGLVVIGPEGPLVAGLADRLAAAGIKAFGPSAKAAQLEGSKGFMKDLCAKYGVPTAAYGRFTKLPDAKAFIEKHGAPIVVKADGLAAGKGVIIAQTKQEAHDAAAGMLEGDMFGGAGASIVIEEFLDGDEISFFALADGKTFLSFGSAQDHKRAYDGDKGPNTGGMGTVSPAPQMTDDLQRKIEDAIIKPTIDGMAREGCPFTGVLFAGLMIVKGEPVLLEFNTRFGDPECQTLMMRLDSDLAEILDACASGALASAKDKARWKSESAVCVVMAANGYPGEYKKNTVISGLNEAASAPSARIFHAGTARDEKGRIVSAGGRVLGVAASGPGIAAARINAYRAVDKIDWPDGFCRRDIGLWAEQYKG